MAMEKINVQESSIIFLDHRSLIAESYKENGNPKYSLRSELFNFQPKKETEKTTQRKRKKRKIIISETDEAGTKEVSFLQTACKTVREETQLLSQVSFNSIMPRVWESPISFPKFKGVNNTCNFQTINSLIENMSFLVPPKSKFFNYDIAEIAAHLEDLSGPFDFIVLDPPWRNKYIRRLKRHNLGYLMLETVQLDNLPIQQLIHQRSIVAIWCTNSKQHQSALINQLLPKWKLRMLHCYKWLKLNTIGEPIYTLKTESKHQKQPYEMLYITCNCNAPFDFGDHIKEAELMLSIPSIIHSHKPPLMQWFQMNFPNYENPKCLEIFARYLQPNFTSFGLEVFKLMDKRLYENST